jgi:diaminopimelate decarboxylase
MHHFDYRDGRLHCEDVDLAKLADQVGTPCYVYSTATLQRHARVIAAAFEGQDCLIAVFGEGQFESCCPGDAGGRGLRCADVVSGGELQRALRAGIPASKIVCSGVGKTAREMELGLREGIHQFNVESAAELRLLSYVANGHRLCRRPSPSA